MKAIVNTEIQDLPRRYKLALGKDTRGFETFLNMNIEKKTTDHWNKRGKARDIHLNELEWYYEIRFTFDSDARRTMYKFDHTTEEGKKQSEEWYHEMTDWEKQPLPYILDNSRDRWLFDAFRRDYKKIFAEMYIDEDKFLKIMRAAKKANENNQQYYTYNQKKIVERAASYYRTTIYNLGSCEASEALEKAGLTEDRGYNFDDEYLVEVVSNSRIENLISLIPPVIDGYGVDSEMVQRFIERRTTKKKRTESIDAILG